MNQGKYPVYPGMDLVDGRILPADMDECHPDDGPHTWKNNEESHKERPTGTQP